MRVIVTRLLCGGLLLALPGLAQAQLGDPASFTDDPLALEHLPVDTFDDPALVGFYFESLWTQDGIAYGGEGVVDRARCIPGMDAASYDGNPSTRCGGDNLYLAHTNTRVLAPLVAADQLGFFYGTNAEELVIEVALSDGTVQEFVMVGGAQEGDGTAGYFGYGTGDPGVLVEQVTITSPDGAIDDVRFGMSYAGTDDLAPVSLETLDAACSIEGLASAIAATRMDTALAQRIDARMAQVVGWWQQGDVLAAVRGLELIAFHLEVGRETGGIDALDADSLLACIESATGSRL